VQVVFREVIDHAARACHGLLVVSRSRTWEHSDATINELPLDAPGHVPWWPEPCPNTNLFAIMIHVLGESIRHAGHADILREGLDGRTGVRAENEMPIDEEARAAYCAKIEQAARSAAPVKPQRLSHGT
jgi:hypothetical protein